MSSRRIEDLDIRFQPLVRKLLDEANKKTSPWLTFITDGFRTYAEQAELYASGRTKAGKILTNAPPGTSNHEKGLAVDLAFQNGGKLSYDQKYYDLIVPIAEKLGITWGGNWKDFPDKPHFEKLKFDTTGTIIQPTTTMEQLPKDSVLRDIRTALCGTFSDNEIKADLSSGKNLVEIITSICNGDSKFYDKWIAPKISSVTSQNASGSVETPETTTIPSDAYDGSSQDTSTTPSFLAELKTWIKSLFS